MKSLSSRDTEWLKLKPSSLTNTTFWIIEEGGSKYFGEINDHRAPHGKGIRIFPTGAIHIGYFDNGSVHTAGHFMSMRSDGIFRVGLCIMDENVHSVQVFYLY